MFSNEEEDVVAVHVGRVAVTGYEALLALYFSALFVMCQMKDMEVQQRG